MRQHVLNVAVGALLVADEVALHVRPLLVELLPVVLRVDDDGVIQRGVEIQHRLQHLVLHLDELQRLIDGLLRLTGHDGHRVAHIAHLPVEDIAVIGRALRVALTRLGEPLVGHVLPGQSADDAGHQLRAADVDLLHPRAGVGRAEQLHHQTVLRGQILRIDGLAGHQRLVILLADALIDHPQLFHALHACTSRLSQRRIARRWLS